MLLPTADRPRRYAKRVGCLRPGAPFDQALGQRLDSLRSKPAGPGDGRRAAAEIRTHLTRIVSRRPTLVFPALRGCHRLPPADTHWHPMTAIVIEGNVRENAKT